ncbi:MAG TPA: class I SAM-dependent methyltransferase [Patescibacteria group bacterium]|nr:class I SAM-dependent methyltransferase [Patescibacteria group bacterium]
MPDAINQYGDQFRPTEGHGVDIASQRQDELDAASLAFIREQTGAGKSVTAIDLGGGYGTHSIHMAEAGASVTMIDVDDMASAAFTGAIAEKKIPAKNLTFVRRDFVDLNEKDLPEKIDLLYSQRAIHYVPYEIAERVLRQLFNRMSAGAAVFISAAGYDTEYGKTYPDRGEPVEKRFNFVTPDMQAKHGILHKIVTYTEGDMEKLLSSAGFTDIRVSHSAFGNIKAMARKP